ncbi:hypothetical protein JTB14_017938 [Gonioctena quinquepunctata]|nr:hypothetical protein JTB14_017938 [Gonioctena quinquepunctata]
MSFDNNNNELPQEIKTQVEHVQKLENDVLKLNEINRNMIITIRALEEENNNLAASKETLRSMILSIGRGIQE